MLRRLSMHQLILYFLLLLLLTTTLLSFTNLLPYSSSNIILPATYLVITSYLLNLLLAKLFSLHPHPHSSLITALILSFLIGPLPLFPHLLPLTLLSLIAMASKYLLTFKKKLIFNPAALASLSSGFLLNLGSSW